MWQSREIQEALADPDPVHRLIRVFGILHPIPLDDSKYGFVDAPKLVQDAHAANQNKETTRE